MLEVEARKGAAIMCRTTLHGIILVLVAGSALFSGCGTRLTGPTKEIQSPEPAVVFTSIPRSGVAHASYAEPIPSTEAARVKPLQDWTEQDAAADALGRIGKPAVPALVQALRSTDADVRLQAVQVLARMGSDAHEAVPDLVALLDDPDERIRKATARTLGRIGPEASPAVPALMRSLLQAEPTPPVELQPVPME